MKKCVMVLVLVSFIMLPAVSGFAVKKENTGCGLGYMIMQGNDGLLFQVLAVTTNGTSGNQTFGITSGTLECEQPSRLVSKEILNNYIADNMDNLARDIARGQGEYLNTLAVLMEVPEGSRTYFYSTLQDNFSRIYPGTDVTSIDVLNNIESLL